MYSSTNIFHNSVNKCMTSHDLIFVISFCKIAVFPCEWKTREMIYIYNYCLSEDLKYMDINQGTKFIS